MTGIKQFVGREVLVSTVDGGALRGKLWRARRGGVEVREAVDPFRNTAVSGVVWIPTHSIAQVQVVGGDA